MRQGNDVGSQCRSAIYTTTLEQLKAALASRDAFQASLTKAGYGPIITEIKEVGPFYYAEGYHQQYLHKNPVTITTWAGRVLLARWASAPNEAAKRGA